jgi:hypothetical protein
MKSRIFAASVVWAVLMLAATVFAAGRGANSNASYMNQDSAAGPRPFAPWPGYTGSPSEVSEAITKSEAGVTDRAATTTGTDANTSTPATSSDLPKSPATSK